MKLLEGQSRFLLRTLLGRRYDTLTDSAQQTVRVGVAALDIILVGVVLRWLF